MLELEEALKLTKGTILKSRQNSLAAEALTKGKIYVMYHDALPYFPGSHDGEYPVHIGDDPVNSLLPIIDDNGRHVLPVYSSFDVEDIASFSDLNTANK
jgi:hypothetical protein